MPTYVFIDGDNIQWETYVDNLRDMVHDRWAPIENTIVFVQGNILFKYRAMRSDSFTIQCSRTMNKNASDARILFEMGRYSVNPENTIVIVSNDKIFAEVVDNHRFFVVGYMGAKPKTTLKKSRVLKCFESLRGSAEPSDDISVSDMVDTLGAQSYSTVRDYIVRYVPELGITANETVFSIHSPSSS